MNVKKERMLDLLTDKVLFGLDEKEEKELQELEIFFPELRNDNSLGLTVGAIGFTNLEFEPLPDHLRNKILTDAQQFVNSKSNVVTNSNSSDEIQKTFEFEPKRPFLQWLGWAFGGLACIALGVSLWANLQKPKEIVRIETPKTLTINEQYDNLLASAKDVRKTAWTNPANDKEILGEIVWSETEQKGFMKFKGLAANDASKEEYQLWIIDETQDEKTPIDGGVFDIKPNGETLIPIDAKLKFKNPKIFAVTVEKPGGVVVSKREKLVAIAKVTT